MTNQFYLYWHPGETKPEKTTENAEFLESGGWDKTGKIHTVDQWANDTYRWPVTEAEWRTHMYCQAYGINVPEGWRMVNFRKSTDGDSRLSPDGNVEAICSCFSYPLLERIEEWVTPTDEDAKRRPQVQVSSDESYDKEMTLVAVTHGIHPFVCINGRGESMNWKHCRMKKENSTGGAV